MGDVYIRRLVFASFPSNNRIPLEFSWNWKETAVCTEIGPFSPPFVPSSPPLVTPFVTKSEDGKILYDSIRRIYFKRVSILAIHIFHATIKISPSPTSIRNISPKVLSGANLRERICLESSLLFYHDFEFTREVETSKSCARSKASSAPHQSLNRKRSRVVCRPIWRTSIFLLGSYLPPHSTKSRLDFRLGQDFFPVQGSRAAIQGWKNRADELDGCRFS